MAKKLKKPTITPRMKLFCKEYLVDLCGAAAAIRAGYSTKGAHVQASKLLQNDYVKAEIQKQMDLRSERTGINADYVLKKINDTIERCESLNPDEYDPRAVLKGCELLGKHLKLFSENVNLNHSFTQMGRVTFGEGEKKTVIDFNVGQEADHKKKT